MTDKKVLPDHFTVPQSTFNPLDYVNKQFDVVVNGQTRCLVIFQYTAPMSVRDFGSFGCVLLKENETVFSNENVDYGTFFDIPTSKISSVINNPDVLVLDTRHAKVTKQKAVAPRFIGDSKIQAPVLKVRTASV